MSTSEADNKPSIEISNDGPLLVKGLQSFTNSKGEPLAIKPTTALCRCGESSNKPFCDGTHSKIGFSGKRFSQGIRDERMNFVGKEITIHDNRAVCAHAGICTDKLAAVFRMQQEPWIDPDGATTEAIIDTIKKCPSGALSYSIEDVEYRDQQRPPAITVVKDGPYFVIGGIALKDQALGEGASAEHYTLCRCGGSKNKPFCDGSHWHIEFKDPDN